MRPYLAVALLALFTTSSNAQTAAGTIYYSGGSVPTAASLKNQAIIVKNSDASGNAGAGTFILKSNGTSWAGTSLGATSCQIHIKGSGTSGALTTSDSELASCLNDATTSMTITAIKCWVDGGTSAYTVPAVSSYYVSTAGNDSWSGTLAAPNGGSTDGPFRTLAKAQTVARGSSTKQIVVRAGTYTFTADWNFTTADNGEAWYAYPGETVILDGASGAYHTVSVNPTGFTLNGFTFQNTAANAIEEHWGNNINFSWNTFNNANQSAILGWGINGFTIDNNVINGQSPGNPSGTVSSAYAALNLSGNTTNGEVSHNLLQNVQGMGIYFADGPTDPPNSNVTVDRNLLINVVSNVVDAGGIYFYDASEASTNVKITNNTILGYGTGTLNDSTKAIYLDDGVSNTTISGNIVSGHGQWALQIHGGTNNTVTNNIFDISGGTLLGLYQVAGIAPDTGMAGNSFTKNIVYSSGSFPSSLWNAFINGGDALPSDHDNLYFSATSATIPNTDVVDSHRYLTNPGFTNASAGDYSMQPSSPAFASVGMTAFATGQGLVTGTGGATVNPIITGGSSTSILSNPLVCGSGAFASGIVNGTPTIPATGSVDANITAVGGSKSLRLVITGRY